MCAVQGQMYKYGRKERNNPKPERKSFQNKVMKVRGALVVDRVSKQSSRITYLDK
jgi:hypothetical protein